MTYSHDGEEIVRKLEDFDHRSQVAFVLSIAERLLPNYEFFSARVKWGSIEPFRQVLAIGWDFVSGSPRPVDPNLLRQCESQIPSPEDFDTFLVSSAMDAGNVVMLLAKLLGRRDHQIAAEASALAIDSVDMFVQEAEDMSPLDQQREDRIRLHPLMQAEIVRQLDDLRVLRQPWEPIQIAAWKAPASGNLGALR